MSGDLRKDQWGKMPSGEQIDLYTLRNSNGIETAITNYGGRIVTLKTPDRRKHFDDIVLGCDKLDGYLEKDPYLGALVGRYANRIANGEFTLGSKTYRVARNNGPNALHGGQKGFDKVAWTGRLIDADGGTAIELEYLSPDGEEGYPGNLRVTVRYTLTDKDELRIDYHATTDKDTILNLTNHSYFNLAGQAAGNVLDHLVMINADEFTPVNEHLIPTGELRRVEGTPFDFRELKAIGTHIAEKDQQIEYGIGFDHNYVLNKRGEGPSIAARVTEPNTGRTIEVSTTEPGVQFYTGNHLDGTARGKGGAVYGFRSGFCLETQHFPDSPHRPEFPSTELRPGEVYRGTTVFTFSIE
jgi:aldose 1-epimerase